MYRVAHESIARARQGSGPTRILCLSVASAGNGSTNAIQNLEAWLTSRGLPAQQWRQEIVAKIQSTNTGWHETPGKNELPENAA
jgi:TPP-dependent pyruvate/acetoin dehydrogenase alpha subunit